MTVLCRACGWPASDGDECPARRHKLRDNKNYAPAFFPYHHGPELREEHWAAYSFGGRSWEPVLEMMRAEGERATRSAPEYTTVSSRHDRGIGRKSGA